MLLLLTTLSDREPGDWAVFDLRGGLIPKDASYPARTQGLVHYSESPFVELCEETVVPPYK